jgi:putative DNA primase/helicase
MSAGNHKPGLRSVDEAIRRRFNLVPFTVTIPPEERDLDLDAKLKTERPGILHWMIAGCLKWQQTGLAPPTAVKAATADYLEAQDAIAAWIDECCEQLPDAWEGRAELFESWNRWAHTAGEHVGTRPRLIDSLERRGFEPSRVHGGKRGFRGIQVKRRDNSEDYWQR